jgi:Ser/Thr protein kinase RdoA (MazF antagonist)
MLEWALAATATLDLDSHQGERLGLPAGVIELHRAWPRDAAHLLLEYALPDGGIVAGQWFADESRLKRVARETAQAGGAPPACVPGTGVLLQAQGADRRLLALAPLVARADASLLVHRAERRAVVRLQASNGARYAKVVRPERTEAILATGRAGQCLAGTAITTPRLLQADFASGVMVWSGLAGTSLYDLSGSDRLIPAARVMGKALRALHAAAVPADARAHSALEEIACLRIWLGRLQAFAPDLYTSLCLVAPRVFRGLAEASTPAVLSHCDFYDKQVIIDPAGRVGLVDFDTLAAAEPALDVANAMVHFELRAIQGLCSAREAEDAIGAFHEGYGWTREVGSRVNAYAEATRLRLACLYAFRPRWAQRVPPILLGEARS